MKKIKFSEITPEKIYLKRRDFIKKLGLSTSSLMIGQNFLNSANASTKNLEPTEYRYISTYNNYYEFGTRKSDPVEKSQNFKTSPWSLTIDGEVEKKITLTVDEIKNSFPIEERIYKLRCVEGWSMIIPWMGFSLSKLLEKASPNSKAKFIEFTFWPKTILTPLFFNESSKASLKACIDFFKCHKPCGFLHICNTVEP